MNQTNKSISKRHALIAYIVGFYSIWTLWEFWVKPFINNTIETEWIAQLIKFGIVKNLVWTLPAVLLVNYFKADVFVGLKEMFTGKIPLRKYLPVFLIFTVYLLIGAFLQKGRLAVNETFGINELIIVLFVGITEEMVFRGWLLNAAASGRKKWVPVIVVSLLFLFIHFPVWIYEGCLIENSRNFAFLSPLVLGIIFGWIFLKSKNIWIPILLHMYWDFFMFLFC